VSKLQQVSHLRIVSECQKESQKESQMCVTRIDTKNG